MKKTSPKSMPKAYQMSIFGQADSLARMSQWRGKGEDYTENELACFLSLFDSSENEVTINPDGLSLKMLRESFPLAEAGILPLFYVNWPHWGTVWNTRLSIPKTTVYPKAESVCTLSEILQEEVPEKYFLSEVQARQLLRLKSCGPQYYPGNQQGPGHHHYPYHP